MSAEVSLRQVFPYWTYVLETIESALRVIDPEAMHYRVSARSRSIYEILVHMIDVFDRDITQFVLSKKTGHSDLGSLDGLLEAVKSQRRTIDAVLVSETIRFLDRKSQFMGHERTYGDALWNVFIEQVHHRGQVFLSMGAAGLHPPET